MLVDAHDLSDGTIVQTRLCVVGSGAAGITLAHSFLGRPEVDVCVLEGGGLGEETSSQDLYAGQEEGDLLLGLTACRQRAFGGTTNLWMGWCHPLEPADFEVHPFVARSGWPIDAQTLAPYYDLARDMVEIGADEFDAHAVGERVGHPALPLDPTRARSVLYQYSRPPTNFGERYGDALTASDHITTYVHANVVDIVLDPSGSAVQGLRCATLGGIEFEVRAEHYVLAMGGIENPRLLLAAAGGPAEGIGNGSGLLGQCFMEHPHYYGQARIVAGPEVDMGLYTDLWLVPTFDAAHPEGRPVEARAALALPADVRRAEQLITMAATMFEADPEDGLSGVEADRLRAVLRAGADGARTYGLDIRAEQRPVTHSTITLGDESDPLGVPRVVARWTLDPADLDDVRRTLRLLGAELGRSGLGRLWMPLDDAGQFSPRREILGGCHHMGATRMSASPSEGVVDEHCRVHGLDNLYVAGSSVFCTGGFANPTLTIVALARRLADHLSERL